MGLGAILVYRSLTSDLEESLLIDSYVFGDLVLGSLLVTTAHH